MSMTGYQGPVDWRQNLRSRLAGMLQLQSTVDTMDDFTPNPDPKYDYLAQAEQIASKTQNLREELAAQNLRNAQIRARNNATRQTNSIPGIPQGTGGMPGGNGNFAGFMQAIRNQESGGNYQAVNSDSGALGAFQIMPSNILGPGGWDVEAIGRDVNRTAFLNHARLQNRIAGYKLRTYFNKYGAAGAASAWYSGDPSLWNDRNPQGQYPSIREYVLDILRMMRR